MSNDVYSNFKLTEIEGNSVLNWRFYAVIDVVTKGILRKPVLSIQIITKQYAGHWYFEETGKFTEGHQVEELVRVFEAKQRKPIEQWQQPHNKG